MPAVMNMMLLYLTGQKTPLIENEGIKKYKKKGIPIENLWNIVKKMRNTGVIIADKLKTAYVNQPELCLHLNRATGWSAQC